MRHGGEASQYLQETAFELVVIEAGLPGLPGLELLRYTPFDDLAGDPEIVILGKRGNNEHVIRAVELEATEYIQRPFAPEVTVARIVRFLDAERPPVSRAAPEVAWLLATAPFPTAGTPGTGVLPLSLMINVTAVLVLLAVLFALIAMLVTSASGGISTGGRNGGHAGRNCYWTYWLATGTRSGSSRRCRPPKGRTFCPF